MPSSHDAERAALEALIAERLGVEVLQSESISVVVWSAEVRCSAANPLARRIFLADAPQPEGRPPEELLPPAAAARVREHVEHARDTRHATAGIAVNVAPDDEDPAYRLLAFSPLLDGRGEVDLVLAVSLDVTNQRKLGRRTLDELHDATRRAVAAGDEYDRALVDYARLMRHRVANPLTALLGGLQTLLDVDLDLDADVRRVLLEAMLESALRIEEVALHPAPIGAEERSLNATPRLAPRPPRDGD